MYMHTCSVRVCMYGHSLLNHRGYFPTLRDTPPQDTHKGPHPNDQVTFPKEKKTKIKDKKVKRNKLKVMTK